MMHKQLCYSCHDNGEKSAPILGYEPHWEQRIKLGRDALIESIIAGKGFMLPKGGGAGESRFQIGKILDYMVSTVSDKNINESPEMQERVKRSMQISNGLKLYAQNYFSCHNTGRNNAPQLGDKTALGKKEKTRGSNFGKTCYPWTWRFDEVHGRTSWITKQHSDTDP